MSRQYLHITIIEGEHGYSVNVNDVGRTRGGYSTANLPPLAQGQHLDADAAAATVTAALEQWTDYAEEQGWLTK